MTSLGKSTSEFLESGLISKMNMKSKLLIVDDHVVLREALSSLIDLQPDFEVVGEAGTMSEAVTKAFELEPDMILMNLGLPDGTGVEATRTIISQRPEVKIMMLTTQDSSDISLDAIQSGAKGCLSKNITSNDLIASLRALIV